jgi:hypothetical protein
MQRVVWCVGAVAAVAGSFGWVAGSEPPGIPMAGGRVSVGEPVQVESLTVFPIYGRQQSGAVDVVSLDTALAVGQVLVRERDASGAVGTLVVENLGTKAILVLAGTVLKGGKQDRQIAQDLVIGAGETAPVDAFCVERGRWSSQRDGVATGGQFRATQVLAPHKVRGAGQYEGNQSKVWESVTAVNAANAKGTPTGTLMATYDDPQIVARGAEMARAVEKALSALPHAGRTVGLAYAVSGQLRGGRWFADPRLFGEHRRQLVRTAAMEALTVPTQGGSKGASVTAAKVRDFVETLRRTSVGERRKTDGQNENRYRKSAAGYSSEAIVEKNGREVEVTVDVLAAD